MFVGNKKKVMDTLINECTQKSLQKVATFLYGFTSLVSIDHICVKANLSTRIDIVQWMLSN